jgi:DNA-binding PadR family transcriptional regulator
MGMKALRGEILDFLYRIEPRYIEDIEIIGIFYQYYRDYEIRKALNYLVGKGYAKVEEVPHPYKQFEKKRLYSITPAGVDILELTKRDDGIIVPERRD